jgi:hypothetical protein
MWYYSWLIKPMVLGQTPCTASLPDLETYLYFLYTACAMTHQNTYLPLNFYTFSYTMKPQFIIFVDGPEKGSGWIWENDRCEGLHNIGFVRFEVFMGGNYEECHLLGSYAVQLL